MRCFPARIPLVESDGTTVALCLGHYSPEFGEEVTIAIYSEAEPRFVESLFVAASDVAAIQDVAPDVTALFGAETPEKFLAMLRTAYRVELPPTAPITILTLYEHPIESLEWVETE